MRNKTTDRYPAALLLLVVSTLLLAACHHRGGGGPPPTALAFANAGPIHKDLRRYGVHESGLRWCREQRDQLFEQR